MSHFRSRALAMNGLFAGFAGLEVFAGGPTFEGQDSYSIFFDSGSSRWAQGAKAYGLTWSPPSPAILRAASQVWANIAAAGSPVDEAFKERVGADMQRFAASIDQLAANHDIFGYSEAVTRQLIARMTDLKGAIQKVAAYQVTPTAKVPVLTSSGQTASGGSAGGDAGRGAPDEGFPWLPVGLGLGAVVLVAGLVYARRRSFSGYRRRRRR